MSDRLLDKYAKRSPATDSTAQEPDAEDTDDLGCFGRLRGGIRERCVMLELRKKNCHILGIGYSWIESVEYEPDAGITICLPGRTIRIKGSGLNSEEQSERSLFSALVRHRVSWVRELDRSEMLRAETQSAIVESIEFK